MQYPSKPTVTNLNQACVYDSPTLVSHSANELVFTVERQRLSLHKAGHAVLLFKVRPNEESYPVTFLVNLTGHRGKQWSTTRQHIDSLDNGACLIDSLPGRCGLSVPGDCLVVKTMPSVGLNDTIVLKLIAPFTLTEVLALKLHIEEARPVPVPVQVEPEPDAMVMEEGEVDMEIDIPLIDEEEEIKSVSTPRAKSRVVYDLTSDDSSNPGPAVVYDLTEEGPTGSVSMSDTSDSDSDSDPVRKGGISCGSAKVCPCHLPGSKGHPGDCIRRARGQGSCPP